MPTTPFKQFRLRSFVHRGRRTEAQERAHDDLWPQFGLQIENGRIDFQQVFGRASLRYLEIGFGSGHSLLALARSQPDTDFIGVETHQPGIGALLLGMQQNDIANLRVFYGDVIDVLEKCIPDASLDGVQIFFPDPWPKRRHHQRRLIQPGFIKLIVAKLKTEGVLHLATDWEHYSHQMMRVVSGGPQLINLAGVNKFSGRSPQRPIPTKFERRAEREGRSVWELQFKKY
jgi:tRNA (guanine-N7-)-methyltransferase